MGSPPAFAGRHSAASARRRLSYGDFCRKFRAFGVKVTRCRSKASHLKMTKVIDGKPTIYIAVEKKRKVADVYVQKARRRFRLRREDGVSDRDFASA